MERRKHKRYNKRLKVTYGERDFSLSGFTGNVSSSGLFIIGAPNVKPGVRLHVRLEADHRSLFQEVIVARVAVVPPELRSVVKGGFGARMLSGRELLVEMIPSVGDPTTRVLSFDTAWSWPRCGRTCPRPALKGPNSQRPRRGRPRHVKSTGLLRTVSRARSLARSLRPWGP